MRIYTCPILKHSTCLPWEQDGMPHHGCDTAKGLGSMESPLQKPRIIAINPAIIIQSIAGHLTCQGDDHKTP